MSGATQPAKKKQVSVKELKEKLDRSKSAIVVDYSKLTVKEKTTLLDTVKSAGGQFFVAKNSLMHIAMDKREELKDSFTGMNGLLMGFDDAIAPLKALVAFQKETSKLTIKKGMMDGKVLSESDVETLSKLPSKLELISTLISRLQGPSYGLVNVLQANTRNLVYALSAIAKKKAE